MYAVNLCTRNESATVCFFLHGVVAFYKMLLNLWHTFNIFYATTVILKSLE